MRGNYVHVWPCISVLESALAIDAGNYSNDYKYWESTSKILQKKAIRCIHKANYTIHTDPLFKHSKIKKLTDIYETQVLLFIHNYVSNKLPDSFNGTFVLNRDMMTSYITRQSNLFYEKKCLTHFASSLPLFDFPHIWNKWKNTLDMSMTCQ